MSGFWGLVVKPGSKPTPLRNQPGEMVMVLKQAALAPTSKVAAETSVLSISVGPDINERFVLCHLTPGKSEQWSIDLGFGPDEEVHFHLTGKCAVHLTGFYEMDDDDDDDDDEGMEEAMARNEGEGMYDEDDDDDDEDDEGEDGEEGEEGEEGDDEIDSDELEEDDDDDDEDEDEDGPRIVELGANGQPVNGAAHDEDEDDDDDDDEDDDDDDDDDDDEEGEFTAEELARKREELFSGLDPSDLASDDDDDDMGEDDDGEEGEEDGEEDDDEDDDDDDDDDEEEEEVAPPPPSKKRSSASQPPTPAAATPSKKPKGTPSAASAAGTPAGGWTPAEEAKLKKAAGATDASTPNRWAKVAEAVGGGKTKDACKKHFKDMTGK